MSTHQYNQKISAANTRLAFCTEMESGVKEISISPHYQIMRQTMLEQSRPSLQCRRVSLLKSSGKSSNENRMSSHEKRLHKILSSDSIEPLSLTDSYVNNQASDFEKGTYNTICN